MMRSVICYCHHISHVFNLGDIPAQLADEGWSVRWLNAFPASNFPLPQQKGVDYSFDVPLGALEKEEAALYLTPLVGQACHFPHRAKRIHFLVSLTSLEGVYDDSMFDHYDAIACAGHHHIQEFLAMGKRRGWAEKWLLPVGYPKLDGQRRLLSTSKLAPPDAPLTVIFAPTHSYYVNSKFSVLGQYGEQIVAALLAEGIKVIFRPHVESWRDQDRSIIDHIIACHSQNPNFVLDRSSNYFEIYAQSHLMLTDISGTGFTYAFTFGRPAIFFAPDTTSELNKTGIQFQQRENIGVVVRSLDELIPMLQKVRKHADFLNGQITNFRDWLIFNQGQSEQYFVANATSLALGRPNSEWQHI